MISGQISFPRFVGTAPGTATVSFQGAGQILPVAPVPFPYLNPTAAFPTQAVWQPDPNVDNVKISLPPNQWVTGPSEMNITVPVAQRAMGPVPNDYDLWPSRSYNNLALHKGWIAANKGTIYNLQGSSGLGQLSTAEKFAIAASVISALALGTGTLIAVLNYRKSKRAR